MNLAMKRSLIMIELLVFVLVGTFGDWQLLISLGTDLLFKIFFFRNHKRRLKQADVKVTENINFIIYRVNLIHVNI